MATYLIIDGNRPEWGWWMHVLGGDCRCVGSIDAALMMAAEWRPDAILLKEYVNGGYAIGMIGDIKRASPRSSVVVVAAKYHPIDAQYARLSDAFAYVTNLNAQLLQATAAAAAQAAKPRLVSLPAVAR